MQSRKEVRIYACGGTGIKVVSQLHASNLDDTNIAEMLPVYLDTSRSDFSEKTPPDHCYVVHDRNGEEIKGKGKQRVGVTEITEAIPGFLSKFPPTEVNLVVFSLSGGTGSTAGPLLLKELGERNVQAIAIVVGSGESLITVNNSFAALHSMNNIAEMLGRTQLISYHYGRNGIEADEQMTYVILGLLTLLSGMNGSLDEIDVANWVQSERVTTIEPGLVTFQLMNDTSQVNNLESVISIASIYKSKSCQRVEVFNEYLTEGFCDGLGSVDDVYHFLITNLGIKEAFDRTQALREEMVERQARNPSRERQQLSRVSGITVDDSGMVF